MESYKTEIGERHFYPAECVEELIAKILFDRTQKHNLYGKHRYHTLMKRNQERNKDAQGFWKRARLV